MYGQAHVTKYLLYTLNTSEVSPLPDRREGGLNYKFMTAVVSSFLLIIVYRTFQFIEQHYSTEPVQCLGPCLSLDQLVIDIHRLTSLIVILGGLLLGSLLI